MNTMKKGKVNQNEALYKAYMCLPRYKNQFIKIRDQIIKECDITRSIFSFWLHGVTKVPTLAKPVIARIMNIPQNELFPEIEKKNSKA